MSLLTTYRPGGSVLHRWPAGAKLAGLALAGLALVLWPAWWAPFVLLGVVLAGYALARLPGRTVLVQLRALLWVGLAIGAAQLVLSDARHALATVGTLVALVLAAGLVSATTSMTALTDVLLRLCRPLQRVGVPAERLALLIALSVRSVPVVVALSEEVRDAQRARGLRASPRAYAVPLLVRALRHADSLGEALAARGVDDEPEH